MHNHLLWHNKTNELTIEDVLITNIKHNDYIEI